MNEVLAAWPDRWRYPSLAGTDYGATPDTARMVRDLLTDLAHPVADAESSVRRLIDDGRFAAAELLLEDAQATGPLTDEARETLRDELREHRQITLRDIVTTKASMRSRGTAVHLDLTDEAGITDLAHTDRDSAQQALRSWLKKVEKAEEERLGQLSARVDEAENSTNAPWVAAVRECLARREFAAAEEMLDSGSWNEILAGPASVVGARWWLWGTGYQVEEVLSWYAGQGSPPPEFLAQWAPTDTDAPAWTVIQALTGLHAKAGDASVRRVAAAIDLLLGHDDVPHPVNEVDGQFRTELVGLTDPRLDHLGLPARTGFWVAPDGEVQAVEDAPTSIALSWRPATADGPAAPLRLPVTALLGILAPDQHRTPPSVGNRRINLLRAVYRHADPALIGGSRIGETDGPDELLRDDLAWTFDLYGVRAESVVLDALIYDVGAHPGALRAAVADLIRRSRTDGELTHDALCEWRADPEAAEDVRAAVFGSMEADLEAKVLVCTALSYLGTDTEATLSEHDLRVLIGDSEPDPFSLDNLVEVPIAIHRALGTKLLTQRGDVSYGIAQPGLVALLGVDRLGQEATEAGTQLRHSWQQIVNDDDGARRTKILHLMKKHQKSLREALSEILAKGEVPESTRMLITRAEARGKSLDELLRLTEPEEWRRRDRREPTDLAVFLAKVARTQDIVTGVPVELATSRDEPVVVVAGEVTLRVAMDNLVSNAVRAAGVDGTVRITVAVAEGGRWAYVDIEDSGPGLPLAAREALAAGATAGPYEGGRGLRDAWDAVESCGGMLELRHERSPELHGAWVRVCLPLGAVAE
jgi:hypothetical protein